MPRLSIIIIIILLSPIFAVRLVAQWVQTNGLNIGDVRCFAVNGTDLFAGTYGGVLRSTNNGTSWTTVNWGLSNLDVHCLAASGANLFAGTYGGGVFSPPTTVSVGRTSIRA